MSIDIKLVDADIIIFIATTDVGTYKYHYYPKRNKFCVLCKKELIQVGEEDAGVMEYREHRRQITNT